MGPHFLQDMSKPLAWPLRGSVCANAQALKLDKTWALLPTSM